MAVKKREGASLFTWLAIDKNKVAHRTRKGSGLFAWLARNGNKVAHRAREVGGQFAWLTQDGNKVVNRARKGSGLFARLARNGNNVAHRAHEVGGFSIIELLVALTLMALLGGSLLTVISGGSSAYNRMLSDKDYLSEARIAMSYITVKLRQNDASGAISVISSDSQYNTRNVLRIDRTPGDDSDNSTFIYFEDIEGQAGGVLVERDSNTPGVGRATAGTGAYDSGNVIAVISDFAISYLDGMRDRIEVEVAYLSSGSEKSLKTTIYLKSETSL